MNTNEHKPLEVKSCPDHKPEPVVEEEEEVTSGGDCGDPCQSSSDCCHPDKMFCCPHWKLCMDRQTKSTAGPNCGKCNQGFFAGMMNTNEHKPLEVKSCPDHKPEPVVEEEEEVTSGG